MIGIMNIKKNVARKNPMVWSAHISRLIPSFDRSSLVHKGFAKIPNIATGMIKVTTIFAKNFNESLV